MLVYQRVTLQISWPNMAHLAKKSGHVCPYSSWAQQGRLVRDHQQPLQKPQKEKNDLHIPRETRSFSQEWAMGGVLNWSQEHDLFFSVQACQDLNFRDWEASVSQYSIGIPVVLPPSASLFDGQNPVGVQAIHGCLAITTRCKTGHLYCPLKILFSYWSVHFWICVIFYNHTKLII